MQVRFTDSISSTEGWSYGTNQIVAVGSVFTDGEIPEARAKQWLAAGLLEAVRTPTETTALRSGEKATHPHKRR